jgi:uncharacterized cupredoxin-like copper-binding protein
MSLSRFAVAAMAMSVSVLALGAGAHDGGHGQGVKIGEPGNVSEADRTINVVMHDNYYEPESIDVKPGETVRFVIENEGSLVHEFNIGTASMHEAHQAEMMMMVEHGVIQGGKLNKEMMDMDHSMMGMDMDMDMSMDMDMGKGHSMKHDDPNSVLLEPGENKEIIWKFAEKGAIEFACNVPGHYQAGMYGDVNFN